MHLTSDGNKVLYTVHRQWDARRATRKVVEHDNFFLDTSSRRELPCRSADARAICLPLSPLILPPRLHLSVITSLLSLNYPESPRDYISTVRYNLLPARAILCVGGSMADMSPIRAAGITLPKT